ncbi:hypothetical protein EDD15DRAFT_2292095 [Pisolithus albus]|nr:hypothetical protein EDD15DRAFT_2292095 [Pisolithus albus]
MATAPTRKQPGQGTKFQPKQPIPLEERLRRLFTTLCAQIDGGHFVNAIKTCHKILRLDPTDADALQTKLFLLLQTEQYEAALSLIGDDTLDHRAFEKAYALYRFHKEEEASHVLQELKQSQKGQRGVLHLDAQLNYRQGSYQTSLELYSELLETADPVRFCLSRVSTHNIHRCISQQSEEYSDVLTNFTASQKHLDFINTGFLHALDELPASVVSAIETLPPPTSHPAQVAVESHSTLNKELEEEPVVTKAKKVRMKRVPKGVIPGVTPPDPERWLKKSERSNYNQGKKRKGIGGGTTQGVVADNAPPPSGAGKTSKGKKKKS